MENSELSCPADSDPADESGQLTAGVSLKEKVSPEAPGPENLEAPTPTPAPVENDIGEPDSAYILGKPIENATSLVTLTADGADTLLPGQVVASGSEAPTDAEPSGKADAAPEHLDDDPDADANDDGGRDETKKGCSAFRGVTFRRGNGPSGNGRWRAQIGHLGKRFYIGSYATPEEAALAYDAAAYYLNGPRATTNFPMSGKPDTSLLPDTIMNLFDQLGAYMVTAPGEGHPARKKAVSLGAVDDVAAEALLALRGSDDDGDHEADPAHGAGKGKARAALAAGHAGSTHPAQCPEQHAAEQWVEEGDDDSDGGRPVRGPDQPWPGVTANLSGHPVRYRGVRPMAHGRWQARVKWNYKYHKVGDYDSPEEAAKGYDRAAVFLFGPGTRTNMGAPDDSLPLPDNILALMANQPFPSKRPAEGAGDGVQDEAQPSPHPGVPLLSQLPPGIVGITGIAGLATLDISNAAAHAGLGIVSPASTTVLTPPTARLVTKRQRLAEGGLLVMGQHFHAQPVRRESAASDNEEAASEKARHEAAQPVAIPHILPYMGVMPFNDRFAAIVPYQNANLLVDVCDTAKDAAQLYDRSMVYLYGSSVRTNLPVTLPVESPHTELLRLKQEIDDQQQSQLLQHLQQQHQQGPQQQLQLQQQQRQQQEQQLQQQAQQQVQQVVLLQQLQQHHLQQQLQQQQQHGAASTSGSAGNSVLAAAQPAHVAAAMAAIQASKVAIAQGMAASASVTPVASLVWPALLMQPPRHQLVSTLAELALLTHLPHMLPSLLVPGWYIINTTPCPAPDTPPAARPPGAAAGADPSPPGSPSNAYFNSLAAAGCPRVQLVRLHQRVAAQLDEVATSGPTHLALKHLSDPCHPQVRATKNWQQKLPQGADIVMPLTGAHFPGGSAVNEWKNGSTHTLVTRTQGGVAAATYLGLVSCTAKLVTHQELLEQLTKLHTDDLPDALSTPCVPLSWSAALPPSDRLYLLFPPCPHGMPSLPEAFSAHAALAMLKPTQPIPCLSLLSPPDTAPCAQGTACTCEAHTRRSANVEMMEVLYISNGGVVVPHLALISSRQLQEGEEVVVEGKDLPTCSALTPGLMKGMQKVQEMEQRAASELQQRPEGLGDSSSEVNHLKEVVVQLEREVATLRSAAELGSGAGGSGGAAAAAEITRLSQENSYLKGLLQLSWSNGARPQ